MELDDLSFHLIHSQDHRVGYFDKKTKIGMISGKVLPRHAELYSKAGELVGFPIHVLYRKIEKTAGPMVFFWL